MNTTDLTVSWGTCSSNNSWCDLLHLNLNHEVFDNLNGVYIIWSGDQVIRIGSGIIKNRIAEHRENKLITVYSNLKVTWTELHKNQMQGVEKFLAERLNPIVGERFPDRNPISVNFPNWN